jgi:multidrug efflux pump subunit AcrB
LHNLYFTIMIETRYPGASPDEVEELVTTLLEDEIRTVDGIDRVESRSLEDVSWSRGMGCRRPIGLHS